MLQTKYLYKERNQSNLEGVYDPPIRVNFRFDAVASYGCNRYTQNELGVKHETSI